MLKSTRRQKDAAPPPPAKSVNASLGSLNNLSKPGGWIPGKTLLKPSDQLQLTEKELDEEFTRILNANNPHAAQNFARFNNKERTYKAVPNIDHLIVHFEFEGHTFFKGGDDLRAIVDAGDGDNEDGEGRGSKSAATRNQFNYSERAAQTLNHALRERSTNTEPPPHKVFNHAVTQFTIFDAYMEDLAAKERAAKEKTKSKKDEAHGSTGSLVPMSNGGVLGESEDYKNTVDVKKVVHILDRMCNQNMFDDVTHDFKYWDDAADEFREGGKGVLLPLWKFQYDKDRRKHVTALCWNTDRKDLFAVGYGSYEFIKQSPGCIACFSLKNASFPEFIFKTDSGVMCLDFHPERPSVICAGLYDGAVVVFDLAKKRDVPIFKSMPHNGQHVDPVWQVCWQQDDLDENPNFISISSDGRVTQWTLLKTELDYTDVIQLRLDGRTGPLDKDAVKPEPAVFDMSSGACIDFKKTNPDIFLVGTEEGQIHKCSKAYNSQFMLSFEGHQMAVYAVKYSPFVPNIFLSASADWTLKLWHDECVQPIMSFDLNNSIGDVAWSPYSSTTFAAVTAEGKVFVYDLGENKYEALCDQQLTKKGRLTHVAFNKNFPVIIVGDDLGHVTSLKLSPNLRKLGRGTRGGADEQRERLQKIVNLALGRPADA